MKKGFCKIACGALFTISIVWIPSPLPAGSPTDEIRATVEKAMVILKNPDLKSDAHTKERRDQLRKVLYSRFDFTEMAKRSLGSHWRRRSPEERKEFVRLFTDLMERSYINKIESFTDETIVYLREILDRNYAEVKSRITHKGEEFSLNYKARLVNGEWKVYDVVVENISLVNNFRSQFNRVITRSSFADLVRKMKEKQIEVKGEKK